MTLFALRRFLRGSRSKRRRTRNFHVKTGRR